MSEAVTLRVLAEGTASGELKVVVWLLLAVTNITPVVLVEDGTSTVRLLTTIGKTSDGALQVAPGVSLAHSEPAFALHGMALTEPVPLIWKQLLFVPPGASCAALMLKV